MLRILCLLAVLTTAGIARAEVAQVSGATDAHLDACNHYENRARFKSRDGAVDFVTTLAEACRAATASLAGANIREHGPALIFLDRLVELRDVIVALSVERRFGTGWEHHDTIRSQYARLSQMGRVTESGEFLIAHRMGLMTAFEAWLDTGAPFRLARR